MDIHAKAMHIGKNPKKKTPQKQKKKNKKKKRQ